MSRATGVGTGRAGSEAPARAVGTGTLCSSVIGTVPRAGLRPRLRPAPRTQRWARGAGDSHWSPSPIRCCYPPWTLTEPPAGRRGHVFSCELHKHALPGTVPHFTDGTGSAPLSAQPPAKGRGSLPARTSAAEPSSSATGSHDQFRTRGN